MEAAGVFDEEEFDSSAVDREDFATTEGGLDGAEGGDELVVVGVGEDGFDECECGGGVEGVVDAAEGEGDGVGFVVDEEGSVFRGEIGESDEG